MEPYWEAANGLAPHSVKYESEAAVSSFPYCPESSLNFSTSATAYSEDDAEYATGRRNKTSRQDPLSHRIIEKRRRDRMNSCLADLSRLIPPQYQRKGRGRIEKTEIIEMAIRHLKHLQNECIQKENEYRLGYTDCMKEAAKFLCDSQMQDFCYRMVTRLQEHCDEVLLKNDCYKARCHPDNISASSGSPHNGYHPTAPLSQLRDILASDIEHSNSNDHNDVKDLSFRNSQPHQAPVITSTAPPSLHHDSSNHDFDSSREPLIHHETANMHSPPSHPHNSVDSLLMQAARMRNFSESSHDIEHNNNYKYKNHIKERFNQDHLHDETSSEHFPAPPTLQSDHSISEHSKDDLEIASSIAKKRKLENGSGQSSLSAVTASAAAASSGETKALSFSDIKSELSSNSTTSAAATKPSTNPSTITTSGRHFAVPIFALHGQGTYYVPLNIDFNSLVPYLNGVDLLDKNYAAMPVLHPININVNFSPIALTKHQQPSKAKIEAITNGW